MKHVMSLLTAACLSSACGTTLQAECQNNAPLALPEFLNARQAQLLPRRNGGALSAEDCRVLSSEVKVTVNGQEGHFWTTGGKLYQPERGGFHPSPERCHCQSAEFFAPAEESPELEISITQGSARVLAHYDDTVSTLRRVPAPTPLDAPPGSVAFWVEAALRLPRFELERVGPTVQQWNSTQGLYLTCPLELRDGGLVVVTPCSQVGDPTHAWNPELRLVIRTFQRSRQPTHCEGAICLPLTLQIAALEDVWPI
jgi:hypothetical protein